MSLEKRAARAVAKFIENQGSTVIDKIPSENIDIVYIDINGEVHFVDIFVQNNHMPANIDKSLCPKIEQEVIDWFTDGGFDCGSGFTVHIDAAYLVPVNDGNAVLKYNYDCFNVR